MSCLSQTYNCTLTWIIENFSMFFSQDGNNLCVPETNVDAFKKTNWLSLKREGNQVVLWINKSDASEQPETVVESRVSIVGMDGKTHFPKIKNSNDVTNGWIILILSDKVLGNKVLVFPKDTLSVKIEMRFCDSNPLVLYQTVRTNLKIERCSFTWSLKNISTFQKGESMSIPVTVHLDRSPKFNLLLSWTDSDVDTFGLQLKLQKRSTSKERSMTVEDDPNLRVEDCSVLVMCKISVLNSHCILPISQRFFFRSNKMDDSRNISISKGCDDLPDELLLRCEFSFTDGMHGSLLEELNYTYPSSQTKDGSLRGKNVWGQSLYKDKKFSDITLKAGNREFKAHKVVLSSTSPVFKAMFDQDMHESVSGVVSIEDIQADTLKSLLKFVYTNAFDEGASYEEIASLLSAANKYQIHTLKNKCSTLLVSVMSSENVARVLYLAYLHEDECMKKAAKSFICQNPKEVLESLEWANFMDNCIRGGAVTPFSSTAPIGLRKLRRSFSTVRQRMSSSKTFGLFKHDQ